MSDPPWRPRGNPWLISVVVTLAAFMEVLDTTIVNVALPHIAGSMAASQDEATWTLTSYLVANGIVLTISGFLGRLFGRKAYFLVCIAMFTVFSVLCGTAGSIGELIVFRLLQGFFGGGLQPSQQAIILDTFPPAQRSRAFSVTAVATVIAPVIGPTLGGWITDHYSWRWIFFINVPIGALTFFGVSHLVQDPPWAKRHARCWADMDYVGLSLITLGLGSLQVMLDRGEDDDWFGSAFVRTLAVLAAAGIAGAIYWLAYVRRPIVDITIFRDRNFAVGCFMMFGMGSLLYSSAVLIPQLSQQELGYTATWAGMLLSPGAILITLVIAVVGRAMPYVQTRLIVATGFLVLGLSMVYSHDIVPQIGFWTLAGMRAAQAAGIGFLFVPISTLAYLSLKPEQNGDASALFTMIRNVSGSIGISFATAMVQQRSQIRLAHLAHNMTPLNQPFDQAVASLGRTLAGFGVAATDLQRTATGLLYKTEIAQASLLGYIDIFGYCALMAFFMIPFAFLFSPAKSAGARRGE